MRERSYELESDYILDVLEEDVDRSTDKLRNYISEDGLYLLDRILAVRNLIEKINTQNALEQYIESKQAI
ncbi:MAG: hypothetical protein E7206_17645 [Clostridium beijerinckii]|nr:hypothetical protein [Clostridium beijerinckii]